MKIKIIKEDGIGAFGAWLAGYKNDHDHGIILLNVEAIFGDGELIDEDGNSVLLSSEEKKRFLVETLTHEFCHALEEYFNLEFDEEFVESVTESYLNE